MYDIRLGTLKLLFFGIYYLAQNRITKCNKLLLGTFKLNIFIY